MIYRIYIYINLHFTVSLLFILHSCIHLNIYFFILTYICLHQTLLPFSFGHYPPPCCSSSARFPHGTEVTFNCIANTIGEKTTWRIHCEDGSWIGQRSPSPCAVVDGEQEGSRHIEEEELEDDLVLGNMSCTWRNTQSNLVTFLEDRELREVVLELPPGTELVRL